jgi:hypothetical protein
LQGNGQNDKEMVFSVIQHVTGKKAIYQSGELERLLIEV